MALKSETVSRPGAPAVGARVMLLMTIAVIPAAGVK